jgi:hypothetical protein
MSRGKQPKLSASQRKHLLELHNAGTHTQEELVATGACLFVHSRLLTGANIGDRIIAPGKR